MSCAMSLKLQTKAFIAAESLIILRLCISVTQDHSCSQQTSGIMGLLALSGQFPVCYPSELELCPDLRSRVFKQLNAQA